jgi:hypothetical protein
MPGGGDGAAVPARFAAGAAAGADGPLSRRVLEAIRRRRFTPGVAIR